MGGNENVDKVNLQEAELADGAAQMCNRNRRARPRTVEALCCQSDAAGFVEGKC